MAGPGSHRNWGVGRLSAARMEAFSRFARMLAVKLGHPLTFALAVLLVLGWAAMGPIVHYSSDWQLFINTGTTILTFLMIFILQNTQNHDSRAAQVKLNELLRSIKGARNELIDLENLTEDELCRYADEFRELHLHYAKLLKHRRQKRRK